jgi:uncharacterized protein YkuJ
MDLKFFYTVELNIAHPTISTLKIADEFAGQAGITLTSTPFVDDVSCIASCLAFMKAKLKEFNKNAAKKAILIYTENPVLFCLDDELDNMDTSEFDKNSLVTMDIYDNDNVDWLIKSSVLVFSISEDDIEPARRLH